MYVFDVEIVVAESMAPCMATAVSEEAWYAWIANMITHNMLCRYSWCSPNLAGVAESPLPSNQQILPENLISIGSSDHPRVVIGHNVGFDRARIAEMFDEKVGYCSIYRNSTVTLYSWTGLAVGTRWRCRSACTV